MGDECIASRAFDLLLYALFFYHLLANVAPSQRRSTEDDEIIITGDELAQSRFKQFVMARLVSTTILLLFIIIFLSARWPLPLLVSQPTLAA